MMQRGDEPAGWWRRLPARDSLQLRLTLELLTISLLGLSAVSAWAGWQLEQTLIAGHKHTLDYIATRFPEQLAMHLQSQTLPGGVERTIAKVSEPGLVVWVKDRRGTLLGHSANFDSRIPEARLASSLARLPERPQVVHFQNYQIVLCASPLLVNGEPLGELVLSRDITGDQRQLQARLGQLLLLSALVALLLIAATTVRISQAVRPLRQMSQAAAVVSADDLDGARLELQQAPAEVSGLAQAFNAMLARLAVSWQQQREFVGNVSHELRTPLTIVAGYLQSLQRRSANFAPDQLQALATARAETERASRLLADLLELARADSGQLICASQPTVLHALLAECAAMAEQVSRRPIRLQLPEADVLVSADPGWLQQVLLNLIDNAVKYSEAEAPIDLRLRLRSTGNHTPVIMFTARDEVSDRVAGLNAGANDYLIKPFSLEELLARVKVQLRKRGPDALQTLIFGDLRINPLAREVHRGERLVELTAKEFDLLAYFCRHHQQVLSREQILKAVWGYDFLGESNIIEVYVRALRLKLEADGADRLIQTVRGVGYVLRTAASPRR
jgi:DNA-binding response OmpR family regulator